MVLCGAEEEGEGKTMVRHMRGLQQEAGGALIPRTAQRRRQGNPWAWSTGHSRSFALTTNLCANLFRMKQNGRGVDRYPDYPRSYAVTKLASPG